jgi:hypothetical protein
MEVHRRRELATVALILGAVIVGEVGPEYGLVGALAAGEHCGREGRRG